MVFDLNEFPWPLENECADEVSIINVLEHLDDTVRAVEELRRICRSGALVTLRVPYFNSPDMFADPTHRRFFSERTFDFFDPQRRACQERPYYSPARFGVKVSVVYIRILGVYLPVRKSVLKRLLLWFGARLPATVWALEFELKALRQLSH